MNVEQRVKQSARRTARAPWFDTAARFGFLARAVIYAIIGVLALRVALGDGGALLGSREATQAVKLQPFGQLLLSLLGVGLACHALWSVLRAAVETRGRGGETMQIVRRIGWAVGGAIHAFLAVTAFQALAGMRSGGRVWLHAFLQWPGGRWILMAVGAITIGAGLYQLYEAYTAEFQRDLDSRMSRTERTWAVRVGRFGLAARGVVLPIVGWFLIEAGRHESAARAQGTGGALREIASQSRGAILLGIVAAGFVAYAVYMVVNARYRRALA